MRHDQAALARRSTAGPSLYFHATFPDGPPSAVVALVHGYAEHGARYAHVAGAWAERGLATIAIDLRGHGRAQGERGRCVRFEEYLDDVTELVQLMGEKAPGAVPFLFGHSFGGLVAAARVLSNPAPWKAVVLSAPYLELAVAVPGARILMGRIASRLFPKAEFPSDLSGAQMTHDVERARARDADPLVFKTVSARWFTESVRAQQETIARAASLKLPLLMVMGTKDPVAKYERARAFFDAASSADKTWVPCEGLFHEVLNEPEWRPIADRVGEWILQHARA
ncbi:MAG TPA: lysophospholipase [Polyangiaceae bacterium]|nr:lysophospholipase [Polyangiaceae bacterium]